MASSFIQGFPFRRPTQRVDDSTEFLDQMSNYEQFTNTLYHEFGEGKNT
jgi:hypothetical protein